MKISQLKSLKVTLETLPFARNALEPHMSEETVNYHYDKHHQSYVTKTLSLLENKSLNLLDVIQNAKKNNHQILYNNSAQVLNHSLFWLCLQNKVTDREKKIIESQWNNYSTFIDEFVTKGLNQFGSGWIWLLKDMESGKMFLETSANGDIPECFLQEKSQIVTICDLWEHAYYIDYRNERKKFLETFVQHLMRFI
jgi:Fe-Mn family superoxide dismutase